MNRSKLLAIIPAVIVAVVVLTVVLRDDTQPEQPLDISAQEPTYSSLAELTEASDAVVVARATEINPGRVIGSAVNANAVVKTQFVVLDIGDVLHGSASKTITLEEEVSLGDGTPITVNGVEPTKIGDEGLFFLESAGAEQPGIYALVNQQSRYLISEKRRDQLTPSAKDALSMSLARLGPFELRCQVLTLEPDKQSDVC